MRTLVDDLRNTPGQWQAMRHAAADRIEALERERPCNGMMIADDKGGVLPFCNLKQRIEALEAAQMILAEALLEAIEMMPLDTIEQSLWRDKARATLAKYEGAKK